MSDEVWDRINSVLIGDGKNWAWLAREIGADDQVVGNWKTRGVPAKRHAAIARALKCSVDELLGIEPRDAPRKPVPHTLSYEEEHDYPLLAWREVVGDLPVQFRCAVPNGALSPQTPEGTVFTFDTRAEPSVGVVVLVEQDGTRYVRRYEEAAAGGWLGAGADGFKRPSSADGGLILAVAVSRWDGRG